jgi:A/G-specific adenine glycosylase
MHPLASRLLDWYGNHARRLPWRGHPVRYAVWLSVVMLQQTRVETVIPYFEKWFRLFHTMNDLASASEQEVLGAWRGLATTAAPATCAWQPGIVVRSSTPFCRDPAALRALPGIGRYTAGDRPIAFAWTCRLWTGISAGVCACLM